MMPFITFKSKLELSEDAAFALLISGNPVDKAIYQLSKISDINEKFKTVRSIVGLTQIQAAQYTGMSRRNVQNWQVGRITGKEWLFPMYAYALLSKLEIPVQPSENE